MVERRRREKEGRSMDEIAELEREEEIALI